MIDKFKQLEAMQRHAATLTPDPNWVRPISPTEQANCLSHWFPKLLAAGLPVPKTSIVKSPRGIDKLADGERPDGWDAFIADLRNSADAVGYPCFLRTGQGSGKHEWKDTCFVGSADVIPRRVERLVCWSLMVDLLGLPTNVFAVREMLPTVPAFHAFDDMPIVREFRCFVRGADVICIHPYWPPDAFTEYSRPSFADWRARLNQMSVADDGELAEVKSLASRAGAALGGDWSVDVLSTKRGWFVTDAAVAWRSYHWNGCERAELFTK
jgi:hypothetical protein